MRLRDSGMPDEIYWETLFDVEGVLDRLGIDGGLRDVVELGCGYGTFTLPVAQRISSTLTACDIDADMVARTRERAVAAGLSNLVCHVRDVITDGFGVPDASQDGCLLFNILHCEQPCALLVRAARTVRPGGVLFVIHWRHDEATPRGPDLAIRPRPEQIHAWAQETGMLEMASCLLDLPPWHYGLRLRRLPKSSS